jgi:predicted heme/steroid binding protein
MGKKLRIKKNKKFFYFFLSLIIILVIIFLYFAINYSINSKITTVSTANNLPNISLQSLKEFNGDDDSKPIYIGLNGKVYDVSAGREFYRSDGPYHYLAGKDSSVELNLFGPEIITKKYKAVANLVD